MLQVGGSAFKRILFTGQVARVVARPCYGGLLRSRETWLFGGMAIEHVYIYVPLLASWILTVSGKQFVLSLPEFENLKLKLHGRFWEERNDDSERGYGKYTKMDIIFIRREWAKFSILKLTRNYFKVVAYIYIYRERIILSIRVIEFSNYLFHRPVIPVISFTSENNNEVLDAPAPDLYYPDLEFRTGFRTVYRIRTKQRNYRFDNRYYGKNSTLEEGAFEIVDELVFNASFSISWGYSARWINAHRSLPSANQSVFAPSR